MPVKSQYLFAKQGEIILSTIAALVIGGLVYQGFLSLWDAKIHEIFMPTKHKITRRN